VNRRTAASATTTAGEVHRTTGTLLAGDTALTGRARRCACANGQIESCRRTFPSAQVLVRPLPGKIGDGLLKKLTERKALFACPVQLVRCCGWHRGTWKCRNQPLKRLNTDWLEIHPGREVRVLD
jgi:hypothetical protein